MSSTKPDARALLEAAAAHHPRGLAGIAEQLGYSRPALSRYMNGNYGGGAALERLIIDRLHGRRHCPHDNEEIAIAACRRRAHAPEPYGGAARHAAWHACQSCPNKPTPETQP